MSVYYNQKALRITTADVYSITTYNMTTTLSEDVDGGFQFQGYHTASGCGGADTGVLILLRDTIAWTKMCFKFEGTGTAACWSFMNTANGNYGGSTGTPTGNMLDYNASFDRVYDNYLTWEVTAYQTHDRTYACDNNADNFFRFNSGEYKAFRMTRRRNVGAGLAGIHHGRSCNSTGSGSATKISDIFVW